MNKQKSHNTIVGSKHFSKDIVKACLHMPCIEDFWWSILMQFRYCRA